MNHGSATDTSCQDALTSLAFEKLTGHKPTESMLARASPQSIQLPSKSYNISGARSTLPISYPTSNRYTGGSYANSVNNHWSATGINDPENHLGNIATSSTENSSWPISQGSTHPSPKDVSASACFVCLIALNSSYTRN